MVRTRVRARVRMRAVSDSPKRFPFSYQTDNYSNMRVCQTHSNACFDIIYIDYI